ncbi:MAG: peptidoglycan-binding protein [Polyangiaceae bacterium]
MARLEDQLTPVSPGQVFVALQVAWRNQFGTEPHRSSLLVLLAQWALETGRGRSMHCFNLGNVKSNGTSGDWCFFRCDEIIGGKVKWFEPDDPGCRFRAFVDLNAGAADYLRTLNQRFQRAWPAVLAGDPAAFAHLLKLQLYYTADEAQYTRTLVSLFAEFTRTLQPAVAAGDPLTIPDLYSVAGLQDALAKLGFDPGTRDGLDGPHTQAAVRQFQATHGLLPDGIAGRLTRSALSKALLNP